MAFSDDDKQYLADLLTLRLEKFEAAMDLKLDKLEQAMDYKLDKVMDHKIDLLEKRLRDRESVLVELLVHEINQRNEAMETRLLTAFHNWASPMDARIRSHSAVLRALDLELEDHSKRLEKLEKPTDPPQAA